MKVEINKRFVKDADKLDKEVRERLFMIIQELYTHDSIDKISNLKKLKGAKNAYRIRLGNYRIGFYLNNNIIELKRILHRKEMYNFFPE